MRGDDILIRIMKEQKGAYTIETAIVFTVAFSIIMFLISMTFIMYEQVRLNSIAQDAAERGAIIYSVESKEMFTGRMDANDQYGGQTPYWRIMDIGNNTEERTKKIKAYTKSKINSKFRIDGTSDGDYGDNAIDVGVKNYFIYKRIYVKINVEYKVPFGGLLNIFAVGQDQKFSPYKITAYAEANVSEPAEFIRTMDLGSDLIENFTDGADNKFIQAIQKAINWIKKS